MNTISNTFNHLKNRGEGALIAYVAGGDPNQKYSLKIIESMIEGGADIIEIGVPFSDPIADGPTIQASVLRALNSGTTFNSILDIVNNINKISDVPIVLLTYYNSIFKHGVNNFLTRAADAGVQGIIVPDLPVEEATELREMAKINNIDTIFLATPTTSTDRLQNVIESTTGFLYLVSRYGVTGAKKNIEELTMQLIAKTLPYTEGKIPLTVGFGLSTAQHVKAIIDAGADGAIVGSALVDIIAKNQGSLDNILKEIKSKTRIFKQATLKIK